MNFATIAIIVLAIFLMYMLRENKANVVEIREPTDREPTTKSIGRELTGQEQTSEAEKLSRKTTESLDSIDDLLRGK